MEILFPIVAGFGLHFALPSAPATTPILEGFAEKSGATAAPTWTAPPPLERYDPFVGEVSSTMQSVRPISSLSSVGAPYRGLTPQRPWFQSSTGHPHMISDRRIGHQSNRHGDSLYDQGDQALQNRVGSDHLRMRRETAAPLFAPTIDRNIYGTPVQTEELTARLDPYVRSQRDSAARPGEVQRDPGRIYDHVGEMMTVGRGLRREDFNIRKETNHDMGGLSHTPAFVPNADSNMLALQGQHPRKRKISDTQENGRAFGSSYAAVGGGERVLPDQLPLKRRAEIVDQSYSGIATTLASRPGEPVRQSQLREVRREDAQWDGHLGAVVGGAQARGSTPDMPDHWNNRSDMASRYDQTYFGNVSDMMRSTIVRPLMHIYKEFSLKDPVNPRELGNVGVMSHERSPSAVLRVGPTLREQNLYVADGMIDRMPGNYGQSGYLLNDQVTHDHIPKDDLGPNPREYGQASSHINHAPIDSQHRMSLRQDGQEAYQAQGGMNLAMARPPVRDHVSVDKGQRVDRIAGAGSATGYMRANNEQFGRSTRERSSRDARVSDLRPVDLQREIQQQRASNPMVISAHQEQQSIMHGFR